MSKLILLYLTLILSCVFLWIPRIGPEDYFLFSDMELYFATYVYFILERVFIIILAYVIANEATKYNDALWMFFWLCVLDLVDFLLCYNDVWFRVNEWPMSMNIFKSIVFGLVILRELWRQSR